MELIQIILCWYILWSQNIQLWNWKKSFLSVDFRSPCWYSSQFIIIVIMIIIIIVNRNLFWSNPVNGWWVFFKTSKSCHIGCRRRSGKLKWFQIYSIEFVCFFFFFISAVLFDKRGHLENYIAVSFCGQQLLPTGHVRKDEGRFKESLYCYCRAFVMFYTCPIIVVTFAYKFHKHGGTHGLMVSVVGNGQDNTSSNPWQDCLHFVKYSLAYNMRQSKNSHRAIKKVMHRKRVTYELHDSYFRSMTITPAIPKIAEVTHRNGQKSKEIAQVCSADNMGQGEVMHRKRVTYELHDSYFRSMTITQAIPKIAEVTHPDRQISEEIAEAWRRVHISAWEFEGNKRPTNWTEGVKRILLFTKLTSSSLCVRCLGHCLLTSKSSSLIDKQF